MLARVGRTFRASGRSKQCRNLVSAEPAPSIVAIADTIGDYDRVVKKEVGATVTASSATGIEFLDLIGHSTSVDCLLRLGASGNDVIGPADATIFKDIAQQLRDAGVEAVRLLGCATATTGPGYDTLKSIHEILNLPNNGSDVISVYGTRMFLDFSYYEEGGLKEGLRDILWPYAANSERPEMAQGQEIVRKYYANRPRAPVLRPDNGLVLVVREPSVPLRRARRRDVHSLFGQILVNQGRVVPGILCDPLVTVVVPPTGNSTQVGSLEVLPQWRLVRARFLDRPRVDCVYAVKDSPALEALVNGFPQWSPRFR